MSAICFLFLCMLHLTVSITLPLSSGLSNHTFHNTTTSHSISTKNSTLGDPSWSAMTQAIRDIRQFGNGRYADANLACVKFTTDGFDYSTDPANFKIVEFWFQWTPDPARPVGSRSVSAIIEQDPDDEDAFGFTQNPAESPFDDTSSYETYDWTEVTNSGLMLDRAWSLLPPHPDWPEEDLEITLSVQEGDPSSEYYPKDIYYNFDELMYVGTETKSVVDPRLLSRKNSTVS